MNQILFTAFSEEYEKPVKDKKVEKLEEKQ